MKKLMVAIVVVLLTGCATPPSAIDDNQFVWSKYNLESDVNEVHYNLIQGFRKCSDVQPVDSSFGDKVIIDVYFPGGIFESRSNKVYGRIYLEEVDNKTEVRIGVLKSVDNPLIGEAGKQRRLWESWSKGRIQCQ